MLRVPIKEYLLKNNAHWLGKQALVVYMGLSIAVLISIYCF